MWAATFLFGEQKASTYRILKVEMEGFREKLDLL